MGAEGGSLLHLDDAAETDVADDDVHGAARGVDDGGLDAVADGGARGGGGGGREETAQDEGERRGADGDGARGVEAAGVRVDAALQGVHVGDVGERRAGGRVRELAPRRRRHAVPRVPVDVLLGVDHHGRGVGVGAWLAGFWISLLDSIRFDFLLAARGGWERKAEAGLERKEGGPGTGTGSGAVVRPACHLRALSSWHVSS